MVLRVRKVERPLHLSGDVRVAGGK
jgi:hypothetical protein